MGKKERRSEWNGARRMDGRWGVWGKAERWSYHREGQERHDRLSSEDSLSLMEGYYCMCLGDSELGYLLLQGGGTTRGRDHPTGEKLSLPWVAGRSYHWQGVWGGGCQSPHLPDWNWSCHLTCCVGREAKELMSKGGRGARVCVCVCGGGLRCSHSACWVVLQSTHPPTRSGHGRALEVKD